jgi:hypothetical protein
MGNGKRGPAALFRGLPSRALTGTLYLNRACNGLEGDHDTGLRRLVSILILICDSGTGGHNQFMDERLQVEEPMLPFQDAIFECRQTQRKMARSAQTLFDRSVKLREPLGGIAGLCLGATNRSKCLIDSFELLAHRDLVVAAVPMVRMQLDNVLRLFALNFLIDDAETLAYHFLGGTPFSQFKDRDGKRLTDTYLQHQFAKKYRGGDQVLSVYQAVSGFVHLSGLHVYCAFRVNECGTASLMLDGKIVQGRDDWLQLSANSLNGITSSLEGLVTLYAVKRNLLESEVDVDDPGLQERVQIEKNQNESAHAYQDAEPNG